MLNNKNYLLVLSSFNIIFVVINNINSIDIINNYIKKVLVFALFINFILSVIFWINPIQKSFFHKLDVLFAKFSFILFIIYTIFFTPLEI